MSTKKVLRAWLLALLCALVLCLTSCGMLLDVAEDAFGGCSLPWTDGQTGQDESTPLFEPTGTRYRWYDADGTLLYEEYVDEGEEPTEKALPEDNEKWKYLSWSEGKSTTEKIATRTPQYEYFVGNVFQVQVLDLGGEPIARGSAFVFDEDGWFITNAHVMKDAYGAQAVFAIPCRETGEDYTYLDIFCGTEYDADRDIYIGKIENYEKIASYYKDIPLNLSYKMDEVTYSVGCPRATPDLVIQKGKVIGIWKDEEEEGSDANTYVCSSSEILPGSSGGILVNDALELLGITTLGWFDEEDTFLGGAAIRAEDIQDFLQKDEEALVSLLSFFHADEALFIGYYQAADAAYRRGEAQKVRFSGNGELGFVAEHTETGANVGDMTFSSITRMTISANGYMCYESDYSWSDGSRRTVLFWGYYDHQKGFIDFEYQFNYSFSNGSSYFLESSYILYSPNLQNTLYSYRTYGTGMRVTQDEVLYAKRIFNSVYEKLTEDMQNGTFS